MKEEFKIGSWYKLPKTGNYIVKYASPGTCSEYITFNGGYVSSGGSADFGNAILINLLEIQRYLPDGHKDKISPISKEQKQKLLNLIREIRINL